MRLVDADVLQKDFEDLEIVRHEWMTPSRGEIQGLDVAMCVLADAPTIDAVQVVRCRDCGGWVATGNSDLGICALTKRVVTRRDYCSWGRRKDGAE